MSLLLDVDSGLEVKMKQLFWQKFSIEIQEWFILMHDIHAESVISTEGVASLEERVMTFIAIPDLWALVLKLTTLCMTNNTI